MTSLFYTLFIFPITQVLELIFTFTNKIFKEPAISILAISAVVNLLCLPLYNAAEKWQELERKTISRLRPKIDRIKAVFFGNERFMILQTLYRQNNYHPVYALRSTFGLLLQIPFFIAAYYFLSGLEVIKGVQFLFISNLGEPDRLISLGHISINLLPIIMTTLNLVSASLYSIDFQFKDKIQLYLIAGLFLVLLYNSPSALVIYWTANNLFSLIKNLFQKIRFKNKDLLAASAFSVFLLYLAIHLLFFYHGNLSLRLLISSVSIFFVFLGWTLIFFRHHYDGAFGRLLSNYFPQKNFALFLSSFITLWVLTGIFLPARLIVSSPEEFSFIEGHTTPFYFIINTAMQSASLFLMWPTFIYFFLKKTQKVLAFSAPIVVFCALINIFIFQGNYGLISLELIFDNEPKHKFIEIFLNLTVLMIPILSVLFIYRFKRDKIISTIIIICVVSLSFVSFYDFYKINLEFQKLSDLKSANPKGPVEVEPLFDLSKTAKNTIIIMLDRAVSVFVPYIFAENPGLNESYSGFVYYPNTVSFNGHTILGAPPLFGGYEYTPLEINRRDNLNLVTKHNEALLLMPKIFSEAGYKVTVTDPPYPNYTNRDDLEIYDSYPDVSAIITDSVYTSHWLKEHNLSFSSIGEILRRNLLWYSLFKISPLALRQGIYLQGDWCAPGLMQKMTLTLNGYAVLDYLPRFTHISPENKNTVLIMLNNTTHEPSFLQAPEYRPASVISNYGSGPFNKETAYHVNVAALKRLGDWFDFLKSNNVYDNTRIIIVSDHGPVPNFVVKTHLPFNVEQFNPLLFVKDFDAKGPLLTDSTFMSNADVPSIAFSGQIEKPVNPFTGNEINQDTKSNPLYIAITRLVFLQNPNSNKFYLDPKKDYYVQTNIFDPANWEKVSP